MASYLFVLERTGNAFGLTDSIPEDEWREVSKYTSLAAARRAYGRGLAEMYKVCGPNAWNSNWRVRALRDVTLDWEVECNGRISPYVPCPDGRQVTVHVLWRRGESFCPEPPAPVPEGWSNTWQCPACYEADQQQMLTELEQQ